MDENNIVEEKSPNEILEQSADKLAEIAGRLSEIFRAGYDAGFIGSKNAALLEAYKQEILDYINEQLDLLISGESADGILNTINEISKALNNDENAFSTLMKEIEDRTKLIPVNRGGTGATTIPGAINKLAGLNAGTPSSVQIIYDSIEKTGVITESCETREFIKKFKDVTGRQVANIEFPHSAYEYTSTGTRPLIHITDMPEDFGHVTLSWNGNFRVRGMFYSAHTSAVYVYSYRRDWEGTAYEVTYDAKTGKYTELPTVFMVNSTSAGVSANLSKFEVSGAKTDTGRQVYKFGEEAIGPNTRYYCMHEDEISPINYPDYGWKKLVGFRGGDILTDLKFKSSLHRCGGYIQRVYDNNPVGCGMNFGSSGNVESDETIGKSERCGIKFMHSQTKSDGTRLPLTDRAILFATDDQLYKVEYDDSTDKYTETTTKLGFDIRYDYKPISKENNPVTDKGNQVYVAKYYNGKGYISTYYCVHKANEIRLFDIWGQHNVAFDSLSDNKEAAGGVITDESFLRRYKSSAMKRDGNGRCSVMGPSLPKHIANKEYVDESLEAAKDDIINNIKEDRVTVNIVEPTYRPVTVEQYNSLHKKGYWYFEIVFNDGTHYHLGMIYWDGKSRTRTWLMQPDLWEYYLNISEYGKVTLMNSDNEIQDELSKLICVGRIHIE